MDKRFDTPERKLAHAKKAKQYLLDNENAVFLSAWSVREGIGWKKFLVLCEKMRAVQEIVEEIKEIQEERLALCTGIKYPAVAIFALKNLYNWVDKKTSEVSTTTDMSIKVVSYGSEASTSKIRKAIKNQKKLDI